VLMPLCQGPVNLGMPQPSGVTLHYNEDIQACYPYDPGFSTGVGCSPSSRGIVWTEVLQ